MQVLRHQLIEQIRHYQPAENSPEIIVFQGESACSSHLLAWLKAQQDFPQFYLKSRSNSQTWAALGEVRSFFETNCAEQFVRETKLPLVGGLTFDKQAYFFLPRILFSQHENQLKVQFFVRSEELVNRENLLEWLKTLEKSTALLPLNHCVKLQSSAADQSQWAAWVEKALAAIKQEKLNKVVLANQQHFQADTAINAADFLAESEKQNTGCYHFLLAQNANSYFVGSSPEQLYQRLGVKLHTEALAGTATMSDDVEQNQSQSHWLLQDKKNIDENQWVADGIQLALTPYCEAIEISDLSLKKLRQVQHLYREITATLKSGYSDHACLQAIHPTAAISGLPQEPAIEFIQNTENFDRTWYAGTLGIMQPDYAEFCVTIRSALIEQNKIALFAGAGIVEGSLALLEWQEIERKASGLLSLFKQHSAGNGE